MWPEESYLIIFCVIPVTYRRGVKGRFEFKLVSFSMPGKPAKSVLNKTVKIFLMPPSSPFFFFSHHLLGTSQISSPLPSFSSQLTASDAQAAERLLQVKEHCGKEGHKVGWEHYSKRILSNPKPRNTGNNFQIGV
jgi:hypothetical protein